MNKMILTALCAVMMANSAYATQFTQSKDFSNSVFSEAMGNDKGNGGDAVIINDEMVMRDFVARTHLSPVEDNIAFFQQAPGLKEILTEISKVNGKLAMALLSDLIIVNFAIADTDLDVLPASQTGVGSPKAQVQLAIRWNNDILVSPRFLRPEFKNDRAYLLIHEAFHGVLWGNEGPLHHTRVRTIVNYLKTQRGHYDAKQLESFMQGHFDSRGVEETNRVAFNTKLDSEIRCFGGIQGRDMARFFGVSCPKESNFDSYFRKRAGIENINLGVRYYKKDGIAGELYEMSLQEPKLMRDLNLGPKAGPFNGTLRKEQKEMCRNALDRSQNEIPQSLRQYETAVRVIKSIDALLASPQVTADEKVLFQAHLDHLEGVKVYSRMKDTIQYYHGRLLEAVEAGKANKVLCDKEFGANNY